MPTEESLIGQVRRLYEDKTGWGDSRQWSNQDFLQLSEMIREQTGVTISHVTLKRIWGKVRYESLPNTHTLNTLVQFIGFDSWRDFSVKHAGLVTPASPSSNPGTGTHPDGGSPQPGLPDAGSIRLVSTTASVTQPAQTPATNGHSLGQATATARDKAAPPEAASVPPRPPRKGRWRKVLWIVAPLAVIPAVLLFLHGQQPSPLPQDYAFSSKKVVSVGLPNSVVFDYDASRSPEDSVVIQQSWDTTRRVKVSKNGHQYTSVYYYPDFYHATLQVQNKVVKTHNLLIETDGWLPIVDHDPVPVYFTKEEVISGGKMSLPVDQIKEKNIPMQPSPPSVWFDNVRDFGDIYSDHFDFETSLKNDYSEGSAVCQMTHVYLFCEGTAIWVPLCAKGCISNADLYFTYFYTSGKHEDLSAFGVDFSRFVKLRIQSDSGHAKIFVNDRLAYTVPWHIRHSKIIGIGYNFQGTGSVDYVSLSNGKVNYRDDF